jgi:Glycosyl transferases group 1
VAVDWHGYALLASVRANTHKLPLPHRPPRHSGGQHHHHSVPRPHEMGQNFFDPNEVPSLFLNMRVYTSDAAPGSADAAFYSRAERAAVAGCDGSVALSAHDAATLTALAKPDFAISVLHPTLRLDMRDAASAAPASALWDSVGVAGGRERVLWCARHVDEKGLWRFVHLSRALSGVLSELGLQATVCGGGGVPLASEPTEAEYRTARVEVLPSFQNASALASLYSSSALFVHPATYDAFGMTVLEAAAFGTPSLLHWTAATASKPSVGVAERIRPDHNEAFGADFSTIPNARSSSTSSSPALANAPASCAAAAAAPPAAADSPHVALRVAQLLCSAHQQHAASALALTGLRARDRALAWGPLPFAKAFLDILLPLADDGTDEL